jgi:signal transduction histidine kinase
MLWPVRVFPPHRGDVRRRSSYFRRSLLVHEAWARILVVDDEPANVDLLARVLAGAGYTNVEGTTDPRRVLDRYRAYAPDLILLDLLMPHLDGVAVLQQLRREIPQGVYLPVIVVTGDLASETRRRALGAGATDFLTKPFDRAEVLLRIANVLETRRLYLELERQNRALEQTVRERTERLLQSEKVATMGSLLAGVAHELNNPLAVLSGHTQLLKETAPDPDVARRAETIWIAADRCVRIVRNFLALARQRPPERTRVRLPDVVQGAVELLEYELRSDGITLAVQLGDRLPAVSGDPHQLQQVVVNLLANAHHAMRRQTGPRSLRIVTRHHADRGRVRLEVTDTGPGIPADVRAKIFEPFFTTKPVDEGTGLGLSLCRSIVEEHGGTIDVQSEPGRGTTFVIELPVAAPAAPAAPTAGTTPTRPVRPRRMVTPSTSPRMGRWRSRC